MPLTRGADGRLGVQAQGGGRAVNIVMNVTTPDVQGFARSQSQIAAQAGTTSEAIAQEWAGLGNVRSTTSAKAAIVDLLNSQADAVLMDEQPATAFRKIFPEAQIVRLPFPDEFYGVAVRKGNARLLNLVNATLEEVRADGRYDWFIDRWLLQAD